MTAGKRLCPPLQQHKFVLFVLMPPLQLCPDLCSLIDLLVLAAGLDAVKEKSLCAEPALSLSVGDVFYPGRLL